MKRCGSALDTAYDIETHNSYTLNTQQSDGEKGECWEHE